MYDVVIIGSGPGGYVGAIYAAQRGARVALVEKAKLGGCCLNRGCIPTKALVRCAEVYRTAGEAARFGTRTESVKLDLGAVMQHKERVVQRLVGGLNMLLRSNGVEVFMGEARIVRPGSVRVSLQDGEEMQLSCRHIIIATGAQPAQPPIPQDALGLCDSSDDALSYPDVPESLLIIGGGVLAVEFACIWEAFGCSIRMIKRSPLILPPIDPEISRRLMTILRRRGMIINTGIYIKDIVEAAGGKKVLADTKEGEEVSFQAQRVLVAMGMRPYFGGLDLDALGVRYNQRGIEVDDRMQTSVPGIWAIGDVVGRYYLAPVASAEAMVAVDNILGEDRRMDYSVVPQCVFSHPEVASVGMTEEQARKAGFEVKVSRFPLGANGKAVAMGETEGLVKLVADAKGKLLGAHMMGAGASELIHEAAVAIKAGMTAEELARIVHAHPTLSETVMEAAHGISGHMIHVAARRR